MIRRAALLLALLAVPVAHGTEPADSGVRWFKGTLEKAMARARTEKKIVLLDAWAHWCGPCIVMDRQVWSRADLARAVEREAVPVKVEVDRQNAVGLDVGDKYGIQALPHILFIDPWTGEAVVRIEGTQEPGRLLELLDTARAKVGSAQQVIEAGDDTSALVRLASRLARADRPSEARQAALKAFALDTDCARDDADDAALLLADLDRRDAKEKDSLARLEEAAARCPSGSSVRELWDRALALARDAGRAAEDRVLRGRAARFGDDPDAWRELSAFLLRDPKDLAGAESAAAKAVSLAGDDPLALAALAEVRLAQDRAADARTLVDRAIKIDPHDPALRELRLKVNRALRR